LGEYVLGNNEEVSVADLSDTAPSMAAVVVAAAEEWRANSEVRDKTSEYW